MQYYRRIRLSLYFFSERVEAQDSRLQKINSVKMIYDLRSDKSEKAT